MSTEVNFKLFLHFHCRHPCFWKLVLKINFWWLRWACWQRSRRRRCAQRWSRKRTSPSLRLRSCLTSILHCIFVWSHLYLYLISSVIEVLFELYRQHTEEIDRMNRNTFREFLHNVFKMTDDILMDRIFKYFDSLNNGLITREEWILGLNIFLRGENQTKDCVLKLRWPGSVDEHIEYCFTIYDLNADGWEYQTPSPHLVHYCTLSLFDIWVSRQSAEWEPPISTGTL